MWPIQMQVIVKKLPAYVNLNKDAPELKHKLNLQKCFRYVTCNGKVIPNNALGHTEKSHKLICFFIASLKICCAGVHYCLTEWLADTCMH